MAGKHINLTATQKTEIRRLTQLANRRIKAAERAYRKEDMEILPSEVVGGYQIKEQWNTDKTPISRSVKFQSQKEYRKQLNYLRSFEVSRPGIKEYTQVQREKTKEAVETSLGVEPPKELKQRIDKMTAPQLSNFWNKFSDKASKLGVVYSSDQAMQQTLNELFPEDIRQLTDIEQLTNTRSGLLKGRK